MKPIETRTGTGTVTYILFDSPSWTPSPEEAEAFVDDCLRQGAINVGFEGRDDGGTTVYIGMASDRVDEIVAAIRRDLGDKAFEGVWSEQEPEHDSGRLDFDAFMDLFRARLGACTGASEIGGLGHHRWFGDVDVVFEGDTEHHVKTLMAVDTTPLPRIIFTLPGEPTELSRYFTTDKEGVEAAFACIEKHWPGKLGSA